MTNTTVITGTGSTTYEVITGATSATYNVGSGFRGPTGTTGPTGPTGPAGPNNITTATTTNLTGFISGNGETVTASTSATFNNGSIAAFNAGSEANFNTTCTANFRENSLANFNGGSAAAFYDDSQAIFSNGTIKLQGTNFASSLNFVDPTSAKTITFPDATGTVALTNDPRFTDARTPLAHTHVVGDITPVAGQHLIGRHAGGSGAAQEVNVGNGLEFQGSGIRRSALTGDITASAGSNETTLAATIAGAKEFSGQLQLTGQAATDANSAMTRELGDARYSQVVGASLTAGVNSDVNTTNYKTVIELSFALEVGRYFIDAILIHNGNASFATSGVKDRLNFSGTATASGSVYRVLDNATTSASVPNSLASINTIIESAPTNRSQTTWRKGVLTVTAAGTLSVQIAQSVAVVGANTTLATGSHLTITRLI